MQMSVIEKLIAHRSLGSGCHAGPHGAPESFRRQRPEEDVGQEPLLWSLQEGMGKAGYAGLGLAVLNNSSGLCGVGTVPRCLVPGPGISRAGEYIASCSVRARYSRCF